jgi:Uma2 family endonuclease
MALQEPTTQHLILHDISWATYQAMLHDLGDKRSTRLTYDRGVLEITMPSDEHEIVKHLLERIVIALTVEFDLPVKGVGSVTLSREDLQRSVEPDACYYIQNAHRVRGWHIDLTTAPPPDLVVEVDVTSPSRRKFTIYAQLGVIGRYRAVDLRKPSGEHLWAARRKLRSLRAQPDVSTGVGGGSDAVVGAGRNGGRQQRHPFVASVATSSGRRLRVCPSPVLTITCKPAL